LIQEHVSDEMRGRTFATLYAVVRLCLLLSLTVSPLFADLDDWLFGLVNSSQHVRLGGFAYSFPGVRLALWGGGVLTIVSGVYARRQILRFRKDNGGDPVDDPTDARPADAEPSDQSVTGAEPA
jgi:hypothetical protein